MEARWSWTAIARKPLRFAELHRLLDGISKRMLVQTLRDLERDGLVTRHVFPNQNHLAWNTDYPTWCLSVLDPFAALVAWASEHYPEIEKARILYDAHAANVPSPIASNAG